MKRTTPFFLAVLLSQACIAPSIFAAQAVKLDRIVAVVNTEIITQAQLQAGMEEVKNQLEHKNLPVPPYAELRKKVLEQLIDKNMQMQLIKAHNIEVADKEVDAAVSNIAKQNKLTLEELKQALLQQHTNYPDFKKHIKEQMTLQKLQGQAVARNVQITEEEVNDFMRKNKNQTQYSAFLLTDILIPLPENAATADVANAEKIANVIYKGLKDGKNADDVLKMATNVTMNDLGWRMPQEIPPLFAPAVQKMKIGNISTPIKAPNGLHILKLNDARGQSIQLTKKEAQNMLFQKKMGDAVQKWLQEIKGTAYIKIIN